MVTHPVSEHTQLYLASVNLMELAGPLGHSPHYVTPLENTDVYEYLFSNVSGVANDVSSTMSSFANRTGRINCISFLSISQYSLNLILHFHFF